MLYGAFARFKSWLPTEEALDEFLSYIDTNWGSGESLPMFAPNFAEDRMLKEWWGRFERLGKPRGSNRSHDDEQPNRRIARSDSIRMPTLVVHRAGDTTIDIEGGRELARLIPNAKILELPGADNIPFVGDRADAIVDEIHEFLVGSRTEDISERTLATVMFTDIVGSTKRAETLGDLRWRDMLAAHDDTVRREIKHFRGREIKSLGDGFFATFDGPGRAVRCPRAISKAVNNLGMEVRVGLHTGEVTLSDRDVQGIAVRVASRVVGQAGPGEVYVSRTVRDLVPSSNIAFGSLGPRHLAGVEEPMEIYAVAP